MKVRALFGELGNNRHALVKAARAAIAQTRCPKQPFYHVSAIDGDSRHLFITSSLLPARAFVLRVGGMLPHLSLAHFLPSSYRWICGAERYGGSDGP